MLIPCPGAVCSRLRRHFACLAGFLTLSNGQQGSTLESSPKCRCCTLQHQRVRVTPHSTCRLLDDVEAGVGRSSEFDCCSKIRTVALPGICTGVPSSAPQVVVAGNNFAQSCKVLIDSQLVGKVCSPQTIASRCCHKALEGSIIAVHEELLVGVLEKRAARQDPAVG